MSQAADQFETYGAQPVTGGGGRWWLSVPAGLAAGVPVAVLLSFAGLLPFYLGPFFFLLFGLVVGAAMYRAAKSARPLSWGSLVSAGVLVIVPVFGASLLLEYWQLGPHAGKMAAQQTRELPAGMTPPEFRRLVGQKMEDFLAAEHPPGGLLGYIRWASSSGRSVVEIRGARPAQAEYTLSQSPVGWTLRVVVSLALLVGGILSQVLPLRRAESPQEGMEPGSPEGQLTE